MMIKLASFNKEPMELRISFDIDRLDIMKRDIYYPDDNIERVIEFSGRR